MIERTYTCDLCTRKSETSEVFKGFEYQEVVANPDDTKVHICMTCVGNIAKYARSKYGKLFIKGRQTPDDEEDIRPPAPSSDLPPIEPHEGLDIDDLIEASKTPDEPPKEEVVEEDVKLSAKDSGLIQWQRTQYPNAYNAPQHAVNSLLKLKRENPDLDELALASAWHKKVRDKQREVDKVRVLEAGKENS